MATAQVVCGRGKILFLLWSISSEFCLAILPKFLVPDHTICSFDEIKWGFAMELNISDLNEPKQPRNRIFVEILI